MSNLQTPFRYDFVGSFLRPEKLKKARRQFNEGKIDAAALKKVEDEAITELVSKIKELGYHVITDGEFRRATWHLDFMWGFDGIGHTPTKTGLPFHGEAAMVDDTYIVGNISVYGFSNSPNSNFNRNILPTASSIASIETFPSFTSLPKCF